MKTPMQELIEELKEQAQFIKDDDCVQDKFFRAGLRNAIKYAEWLLDKEKEVIIETSKNSYIAGYLDNQTKINDSMNFPEEYYNETFNNKWNENTDSRVD